MCRSGTLRGVTLVTILITTGCAGTAHPPASPPPADLLGHFADDYGARYEITATTWTQGLNMRFHIVEWKSTGRYLIARNDSANSRDGGLWTRIDWLPLEGMSPYRWGFCYSAYRAPSAAAAESVSVARRETPRTGCNGFPFTRMRPAPLDDLPLPEEEQPIPAS